ncbi:hypothetical protein Esi_0268_0014 [Ectocarpus siliculosus]|uniref:Uncharacterized protein n=1 Tax=Ectocarpus siliculosus TaxID=2880 RepID=D7FU79_ECTSI|nr:hypothetical protein Esi_0268_0014 [Ectocarpus siliculosus]|eukprot:CBJ31606.1 hypothetical protein Esi_0268_0014 [Ectocarpus siliculosus]
MEMKGSERATQGEDDITEILPAVTEANGGHTIIKIPRTDPIIKADFVFPEPLKPVLPPTTPTAAEEASSTTSTKLARASPLITPLSVCLAGGVFAVVAAAAWVRVIRHCTPARRRSFSRKLSRLCAAADLALKEERSPVSAPQGGSSSGGGSGRLRSLGSDSGSLRDRAEEAERQQAKLKELLAKGFELGRRVPWEAAWRREDVSRRLESYARELSQRLAKVERAAKELNVMAEIEQLLDRLASDGGGVRSARDLSAGGNGGEALDDRSEINDGGRGVIPHRARLSSRAASPLSRRSSGRSDSHSGENTGCVFREELTQWCDRLAVREKEAEDWFKLGLKIWDLNMADRGIEQLRLLQRPETVHEFQEKREIVRHNRWEVEEELKKAVKFAKEGDPSTLRKACVKAETFSGESLDEYQTAKQLLKNAQAAQLEKEARRILSNHGIFAHPRCNVRFDSASGPALLLRDVSGEEKLGDGGDGGSGLEEPGADCGGTAAPCMCRRHVLDSVKQEAGDHRGGAPDFGGVIARKHRRVDRADESCGRQEEGVARVKCSCSLRRQPMTSAAPAVEGSVGSDVATWARPSGGAVAGGETLLSRQEELLVVRRSAETEFKTHVTKLQEDHKRACEKEASRLKAWYAEESYRQAYFSRLDERSFLEASKIAMEMKRMQDEEAHRRREEVDAKRRRDDRRLEKLQARDGDFWLALSALEVCLVAAVAAYNKGLTPRVVLDAAREVLVAECADGGVGVVVTLEGGTTGALEGYDDGACGARDADGGWWRDAADGSEGALWWALSYAGSTAGAVVRAGYSSGRWLLGKTLGLVIPDVRCEARTVFALVASLFFLALASRIVGGLLGSGRAHVVARRWLLVAWVWARFQGSVLRAVWELLMLLAPTPALVMAYGYVLGYVERYRKPGGRWWVRGRDVRPVWFRVLPTVVSSALAWFLGARALS